MTHYTDSSVTLHHGDCLDVLAELPDASVDAVVCDPPYGLANTDPAHVAETITRWVNGERDYLPGGAGFMGKAWDAFVPPVAVWDDCLRVLKPGGHVLAFAGSRTVDLMTLGLRLAGFDIRDSIAWLYGSGFPKSLDVSKAIDKQRHDSADVRRVTAWLASARATAGVTNRDIDAAFGFNGMAGHWTTQGAQAAIPTLDQVPGLLTVLRLTADDVPDEIRALLIDLNGMKGQPGPAWFAREVTGSRVVPDASKVRPHFAGVTYQEGYASKVADITAPATDAARAWQGWGTALKPAFEPIVVARKPLAGTVAANVLAHGTGALNIDGCRMPTQPGDYDHPGNDNHTPTRDLYEGGTGDSGRQRPPHAAGRWPANVALDESQAAALDEQSGTQRDGVAVNRNKAPDERSGNTIYGERNNGERSDVTFGGEGGASRFFYVAKADASERVRVNGTAHPTVKPLALMRWLVRLVTPPGGTVLEPFAGSGTTVEACILEGFKCVAIEREADYLPLIVQRINRRRDPVQAVKATGDDGGLFDLLGGEAS